VRFSLRTLAYGVVGVMVLAGAAAIGATAWVNHRVTESQMSWNAYRDASSTRARALVEISDQLGYGGAIHNLLNFALRGDAQYAESFRASLGSVQSAVNRYRTVRLSNAELQALDQIEDLVGYLKERAEVAQVMRAYGGSPRQTAQQMALWSPDALGALTALDDAVTTSRANRSSERTKLEILHDLRRSLGFGGMIDYFMKLVLLGEPGLGPMAREAADTAEAYLEQYRDLPINSLERAALREIDQMISDYRNGIDLAVEMVESGASSRQVDAAVRVDDRAALAGLGVLERVIAREASRLTRQIDRDLALVARLSDILVALLAVGTVLLSGLIAGVLLNSVQRPLSRISEAMVRIPEGDLGTVANVDSRVGEIIDLASSLNIFKGYASELDRTISTLQRFQALSTDVSLSMDERIEKILHLGVAHFGTDLGTASCTVSGRYVVEHSVGNGVKRAPGTSFDLETTYCSHALEKRAAMAYHDIERSELADALCYRTFSRKCYIGAPVMVEGEVYGTINFSSMEPRQDPFSKGDTVLVEMMARWLGMELEGQRAMERLASARDAAEEGTRAKSSFLANMSHEIRTPLNGIIGLSRLLAQTNLAAKQRDYVRKVLFSSENLLGIINDILDFSKIEAGQLTIETTDFRLLDVIEGVSAIVAPRAAEKGLEFLVSVDPNAPQDLVGDPLRLSQILTNLCTNAIKFTERGEILVSIHANDVSDGRAELGFSVRDTGVGMTPEQVNQIFRPFTQADVSTTRKFGGTGLGLTISKEFAERMDGRIWVESELGVGSTFKFTVRLALGNAVEQGPVVLPADLRDLRILVVDDNEMARLVIGDTLRSMGFDVDVAASGNAALRRIGTHEGGLSHNIVLLDWMMPGLDGIETARKIREKCGDGPVPSTILVSAYMPDEAVLDKAESDLAGFVAKPVNQSTLFDAIASAVGARSGLSYARSLEPSLSAAALGGLVVLLAEDNEINQEVALSVLRQQGITVDVVDNGQQAVDRMAEVGSGHYDAILMDVQMPVMDGLEATRRIKGDDRFADLPIIAMTAHALEEERQKCFAAGMVDHVAKPLDEEKLFAALARHCHPSAAGPAEAAADRPEASAAKPVAAETLDLDRLTTIDLDALRRALPDDALTGRLLLKFRDGQRDAATQMRENVAAGNREEARRLAHQVRGIAGNLRAMDVLDTARDLELQIEESGLDDAARIPPLVDAFASALEALFADIDAARVAPAAVEASEAGDAPPLDIDDVKTLIDQLRSGDMDAEDSWKALEAGLRGRDGDLAGRVADRIDELDYDAAAAELETLLSPV